MTAKGLVWNNPVGFCSACLALVLMEHAGQHKAWHHEMGEPSGEVLQVVFP